MQRVTQAGGLAHSCGESPLAEQVTRRAVRSMGTAPTNSAKQYGEVPIANYFYQR